MTARSMHPGANRLPNSAWAAPFVPGPGPPSLEVELAHAPEVSLVVIPPSGAPRSGELQTALQRRGRVLGPCPACSLRCQYRQHGGAWGCMGKQGRAHVSAVLRDPLRRHSRSRSKPDSRISPGGHCHHKKNRAKW
eukprot:gene24217-biopygen22374